MCVSGQRLLTSVLAAIVLDKTSWSQPLSLESHPQEHVPHCLFFIEQWGGEEMPTSRFPSSWSSGRVDTNIWDLLSRHFPSLCWNILAWLTEEIGTSLLFPFYNLIRKHEVGDQRIWLSWTWTWLSSVRYYPPVFFPIFYLHGTQQVV